MTSLLLIGCGNMGGALLKGWAAGSFAEQLTQVDIVKPTPPAEDLQIAGVNFHTSLDAIEHTPDIIVWGVKPHQLEGVIPQSVKQFGDAPLYISIAAGKTLANLSAYTGGLNYSIVRAMPNTPVIVNLGITGLCANTNLDEAQGALVEELFSSVGTAAWIDEAQMNALTALCGSGPAYAFYFMECLAHAAEAIGLDSEAADILARQMLLGAAELAASTDEGLVSLRENVTSPNGVTAAALNVWMEPGTLDGQAKDALEAAISRAVEMES